MSGHEDLPNIVDGWTSLVTQTFRRVEARVLLSRPRLDDLPYIVDGGIALVACPSRVDARLLLSVTIFVMGGPE